MKTIIRSCNKIDDASKDTALSGSLSSSHSERLKQTVTDYFQMHMPTARHHMLARAHAIAVEEITTQPDKMTRRRVLIRWHAMVMAARHVTQSEVYGHDGNK